MYRKIYSHANSIRVMNEMMNELSGLSSHRFDWYMPIEIQNFDWYIPIEFRDFDWCIPIETCPAHI